ncbi:ATP-binding protein [Calderihabitans maritimus]|uniref:IstB-like ATP-binding protein n=1 Tax=Calderihabitans maritimus TaxID=1246530 RepID=A0A1Z5HQR0_9FIRM|nr:ATP-binding protein [Calderihabitans maritimus]GAW91866.1 IstB-like ATP-binding protein [Calderihabitans maritimus]
MQHVGRVINRVIQAGERASEKEHKREISSGENCPRCRGQGIYLENGVAHRCSCMKQKAINNRFRHANLVGRMREYTFEKFDFRFYSPVLKDTEVTGLSYRDIAVRTFEAAKRFVEEVKVNPHCRGLFVCGPTGSGKTFLAAAIANSLILNGHQVLFTVVPDLLDEIKATYDRPDSAYREMELIDAARRVEVLILDDLGAHNYTDWTRNKIYSILNFRLNHRLPAVITSNLELAELEEYLGERTTSRIVEMCRVYRLLVDRDIRYLINQTRER